MHHRLLLSLFCALLSLQALALPKLQTGPVPAWLEPATVPAKRAVADREISSGYYLSLLEEQTNVDLEENYTHTIKKIINESGVQANSQMTISFVPEFQQLTFHKIILHRGGVAMSRLDLSRIRLIQQESELGGNIYTGIYDALLILEDLRKGDEVELAYTITGENPIFNRKFNDVLRIASYTPILSYTRTLILANNRKLYFRYCNDAPPPVRTQRGSQQVYSWKDMYVPAYNSEGVTPNWYVDYKYAEISEYATWNELARWNTEIIHNYNYTFPTALQQRIDGWKKDHAGDDPGFAQEAARFVQDEIRYQGMEIGPYTHLPYTPGDVYNKRYGDCKDKALLLACILRSQHIPAWICLVNTNFNEHISEHLPGSNMFNHMICKAVIGGHTVWIDATIAQQRGHISQNYIPSYGKGLVVDAASTAPETITGSGSHIMDVTEKFDVGNDVKDSVLVSVYTVLDKEHADIFRSTIRSNSMQQLESEYIKYYERFYEGIKMTTELKIKDDSIKNVITTEEFYSVPKFWKEKDNGAHYFEVYARSVYDRIVNPDNAGTGKPLAQFYPSNIHQTMVINCPEEWSLSDEPLDISTDEFHFTCSGTRNGNQITLSYTFQTFTDHIPAEKVAAYKKQYERMVNSLTYSFTKGQTTGSTAAVSTLNWMGVFLGLIALAAFIFLARQLNRQEGPAVSPWPGWPIDSWLILLAIVLVVRTGIYYYYFFSINYFKASLWGLTTTSGSTSIQVILLLEMLKNIFGCVGCIALLYWFFKRRSIFPRMLILFAITELSVNSVELLYAAIAGDDAQQIFPGMLTDRLKAVVQGIVFLLIWGNAMRHTERARRTFVRPWHEDALRPVPEPLPALPENREPYGELP